MDAVLERISVRQFLRTLTNDEFVCVLALYIGFTQRAIADAFDMSPASVCRMVESVRRKYAAWDRDETGEKQ